MPVTNSADARGLMGVGTANSLMPTVQDGIGDANRAKRGSE